LGELYFGAARGIQHALYLSLGSGFGGGVIANGQLVTGAHHLAGGIGHYAMDPQGGDPCTCGLQGCPETVLSGQALVRRVQKRAASGDGPTHGLAEPDLSPERVVRAAELADPLALLALAETGRLIGAVAGPYVAVMNPQRIILGGGLGLAAFPFLAPAILEELGRRVLPACLDGLEIVPSRLRSSAVGAACLVFESLHLASRAGFSAIQAGLGGPPGEDSLQGDGHERA